MMQNIPSHLLVRLYQQPETALELTSEQWHSLVLILRHHQLLARYQYIFASAGIIEQLPDYAKHHLENARIISEKQYQQVFFEAKELIHAFGFNSEHKIFLKGAAYTLSGLTAGKGRIYSDIDLLIDQKAIEGAEKNLLISGWLPQPINSYDDNYYRQWSHELPPLQHGVRGTILDLHHNLVPIISGRSPDISHFLRYVNTTPEGYSVLSPAAMTLHSTIHLFFNEEFKNGFRDLLDLDLLVTEHNQANYWTELLGLAEETGFTHELALAVRYLQQVLNTQIPKEVMAKLRLKQSLRTRLSDFVFSRVLIPSHPLVTNPKQELAILLAFLRGHFLKMPLHILLYHTLHKSYRNAVEYLLGKTFFDKEDKAHRF